MWWTLTREHIVESIRRSHETSPGPDGIPYKAYKKLGSYGVGFLLDVAEDLQEPHAGSAKLASFNHAILCCLPKTTSWTDPVLGDIHAAKHTRPLSILNTDNCLIANAYRILLEPVMNKWVSHMQRGFLHGRFAR